ncbi:MAG: MurT ligase domain-containing protein [Candidatus Dormibacteraceae bacterium]
MRYRAAVLTGKAIGAVSRWSGKGAGANFPGDIARKLDPGVLRRLATQFKSGTVLVTGTNGKTTTARLVAHLLEGIPARVVANRTGANLIYGATATVIRAAGPWGRLNAEWGVFEIDEATLPRAVEEIAPQVVVVGNLFRDQLDRYGELESLANNIQQALIQLPQGARAVLNADDPRVAQIGLELNSKPLWYGLDDPRVSVGDLPHAADARSCPRCGGRLDFSAVYVGHDGNYRCPNGDFVRPELAVAATDIELKGLDSICLTAAGEPLQIALGGLYNAYNLLAAFAVSQALGLNSATSAKRLAQINAAFGRQERFERDGRRFNLMLAKNPTGFNEILRTAHLQAEGHYYLIALNDRLADGRDVSWIWDVDFEVLAEGASVVIPSGERAYDLAIRLKYGGIQAEPPLVDLSQALDKLIEVLPKGAEAHLLCTYTAMLELRGKLVQRGWVQPYWS